MKFVKVNNPIISIATGEIVFGHRDVPTTLRRIHRRKTQWMIRKDGIYVRKELVDAYQLNAA